MTQGLPPGSKPDAEFDYIVIGAGTAGGVVAARLSEDPDVRVLVLEAGPDRRTLMHRVPAGMLSLYQAGNYHWDYVSEPEIHADGQSLPYRMGRIIGGSSSINAMVWVRGAPAVYDEWHMRGCTGWDWQHVEPVYQRIERFSDPSDSCMGLEGPIAVTRGDPAVSPLNIAFLDAAVEAGHDRTENYNGLQQDGACVLHRNTDHGERSDVYREYLVRALKRRNLTVSCNAQVEKLLLANDRVTGVCYHRNGRKHVVVATREVVLSAGVVASPQILMLSGIGNPDELNAHGIPVTHELPGVGKNLHTHPAIRIASTCKYPVSLLRWTVPPRKWLAGIQWLTRRTGPAASNNMDAGLFMRTQPELSYADAQITFTPLILARNYDDGMTEGYCAYMELTGVRSRGRLRLRSGAFRDSPSFRFNFLQDERDLAAFRTGVERMREILAQPAFDAVRGEELDPGPDIRTGPEIDAWIRRTVNISHHLAGTCRMGPPDDPDAVVSPDLTVHGLDGLRVADNSIMPFVSNGNTHAPAIMIGERASDFIRGKAL